MRTETVRVPYCAAISNLIAISRRYLQIAIFRDRATPYGLLGNSRTVSRGSELERISLSLELVDPFSSLLLRRSLGFDSRRARHELSRFTVPSFRGRENFSLVVLRSPRDRLIPSEIPSSALSRDSGSSTPRKRICFFSLSFFLFFFTEPNYPS